MESKGFYKMNQRNEVSCVNLYPKQSVGKPSIIQGNDKYISKTASNGVTLLGSILKYAFEQGLIKHNPYYGVKNSMCK